MLPPCSSDIKPNICHIDDFEFLEFDLEQDLLYYSIWEQESRDAMSKQQHQQQHQQDNNPKTRSSNNSSSSSSRGSQKRTAIKRTPSIARRSSTRTRTRTSTISPDNSHSPVSSKRIKSKQTTTTAYQQQSLPSIQQPSIRRHLQRTRSSTNSNNNNTNNNKTSNGNNGSNGAAINTSSSSSTNQQQRKNATRQITVDYIGPRASRALKQMVTKSNHHNLDPNHSQPINIFDVTQSKNGDISKKVIKRKVIKNRSSLDTNNTNMKFDDGEFRDDGDLEIDQMEKEIRSILAGKALF